MLSKVVAWIAAHPGVARAVAAGMVLGLVDSVETGAAARAQADRAASEALGG